MSIVSIHSFRGGTGKSNTTANVTGLLAKMGLRVGVIDTDIQSPGIHVLFRLDEADIKYSLNDYLWGRCKIEQAAYDVTGKLHTPVDGKVFMIPSSIKTGEITRILREGYDVARLSDGLYDLIDKLALDVLMIDTHPGLNEETLLSIAISDVLFIILRPDKQDYLGTGVTVEVARKLDVPRLALIVNKMPPAFDPATMHRKVSTTYQCDVVAVLPHSDEMMTLASSGVFVLHYPDHPVTDQFARVVAYILEEEPG